MRAAKIPAPKIFRAHFAEVFHEAKRTLYPPDTPEPPKEGSEDLVARKQQREENVRFMRELNARSRGGVVGFYGRDND